MKKLALIIALMLCLILAAGCGKDNGNDGSEKESSIDSGSSQEAGVMPDKFSFSGGTGKVGISCKNIVWRNDAAFATIVFDSDAYTYIRVGENQYNCEHDGKTSYAEIPVLLNENFTIYAETTKMSEAHEIEYTIFIYSEGTATPRKYPYALIKAQMDETTPLIPGVPEASPEALIETDWCIVFTYEHGIYLLEERMMADALSLRDSMRAFVSVLSASVTMSGR